MATFKGEKKRKQQSSPRSAPKHGRKIKSVQGLGNRKKTVKAAVTFVTCFTEGKREKG